MTTTAAVSEPARPRAAGQHDRTFYSGIAIAMALTVLVGFGPTYYLRAYFGATTFSGNTALPPLVHLHGLLFSAWVLLFVVQTALVAGRRVAVHRRLGIAGLALASAMIVVGVATALAAARRGAAAPGTEPLVFLVVPLGDIVLFAGFVAAAAWMRRNKDAHKRFMLLAYAAIIPAAVARIPGVMPLGVLAFFGLGYLFAVVGAIYDWRSRGRVHPVYLWGIAILSASVPLRLALAGTSAWRAFAEWLVR